MMCTVIYYHSRLLISFLLSFFLSFTHAFLIPTHRTRSLDHLVDVEASSTGRCLNPMHTLFGAPHPSSFPSHSNDGLNTLTPSSPTTISLKRGVIRTKSAHHGLVTVTPQDISLANPRYIQAYQPLTYSIT